MKIAFLSFFSGIVQRGVETLVDELSHRLVKKHELVVFQAGGQKTNGYTIEHISTRWEADILQEPLGIKRRLFLDNTSLAICEFTKKALPILKKNKFDVVVPWNNGWQTFFCKFSNVGKVVVVGQSGLGWDDRVNLWLFPDVFVGFTDYQCNWAKKVNPFIKVVKISNGIDQNKFTPKGSKISFDLSPPIILTVAALVPMKRLDLAIRAVAMLDKGSLLLVGRGELKNYLQELGDKLLPGRFKMLEATREDIPKVYRSADLFTYPTSSWESFGIAMLEAMATNLPVVANDDPIRREIVGDGGILINPTDTEKYADALGKALQTTWGNKPRKQAEKFSWDIIAKKYEDLFEGLIK